MGNLLGYFSSFCRVFPPAIPVYTLTIPIHTPTIPVGL
jgi:hypothetical protein